MGSQLKTSDLEVIAIYTYCILTHYKVNVLYSNCFCNKPDTKGQYYDSPT